MLCYVMSCHVCVILQLPKQIILISYLLFTIPIHLSLVFLRKFCFYLQLIFGIILRFYSFVDYSVSLCSILHCYITFYSFIHSFVHLFICSFVLLVLGPVLSRSAVRKVSEVPDELFELRSTESMDGNAYLSSKLHQAYHHYIKVNSLSFIVSLKFSIYSCFCILFYFYFPQYILPTITSFPFSYLFVFSIQRLFLYDHSRPQMFIFLCSFFITLIFCCIIFLS